jgi:hypothetical protein
LRCRAAYGPGRIGALLPAVLASRYGKTVEAIRQVNPELQDLKSMAAVKGDSL